MEQITKFYKLICGALIIIFCALPYLIGISGFDVFFKIGTALGILPLLAVLLIVLGAAALIFVSLTKDIEVAPKFTLGSIAKLAIALGIFLIIFGILGIGLILTILVLAALIFEDKVVALLKK